MYTNSTQGYPMSPKAERISRGSLQRIHPNYLITARSLGPPGLFSSFVANKSTSSIRPKRGPWVALGWPLRHAWVTQGSPKPNPKPNPNPNPNRQRVANQKCKNPASSRVKKNRIVDPRLGPNQARFWLDWVEKPSPGIFNLVWTAALSAVRS